jgi:ribosomal protein S27E
MNLKCQKCKHEWNYKGQSKYYVTCPRCYTKVDIQKQVKGGKKNNEEIHR